MKTKYNINTILRFDFTYLNNLLSLAQTNENSDEESPLMGNTLSCVIRSFRQLLNKGNFFILKTKPSLIFMLNLLFIVLFL